MVTVSVRAVVRPSTHVRCAGSFLRKIGGEGITSFPNGIDVSDAGDILIGDSHGNKFHVTVFDQTGKLQSEFDCPNLKVGIYCADRPEWTDTAGVPLLWFAHHQRRTDHDFGEE
jgi:hypothetical protein